MDESNSELLTSNEAVSDWGDFSAVITQLEQQESATAVTDSETEQTEPVTEDKSESVALLLSGVFSLAEQATSALSGVEFEFDAKGKEEVINAALPVLAKRGDSLIAVFGDYIEEGALLLAVIGLVVGARKSIAAAKAHQGGEDGKAESATAQAS